MRSFWFLIVSFMLLLIWGSENSPSAPPEKEISREEVLAKVNGEMVSVGRYIDYLKGLKTVSDNVEDEEVTKKERLEKLIREILIDQRAAQMDLDTAWRFVKRRDKHMQDFLLEYMYQRDILDKIEVTDQQIRDHYQAYLETDFLIPEERKVADLMIPVRADSTEKDFKKKLKKADRKAKKRIKKFYKRVLNGEDLEQLCRKYYQEGEPCRIKHVGFFTRGRNSPEFDSAAFSLEEIGDISKPVKDSLGYHIIQLLERKEQSYYPLDSALFEGIREYLKEQKSKEIARRLGDSLKSATEFVYNQEVLESGADTFSNDTWVMVFSKEDTVRFEEYDAALGGYLYNAGKDTTTIDDKRYLLENFLALPVLLRKEAEKRGYADLIEYQAEKRAFTLEEAKLRVKAKRVKKDFPPPSPEEMREYYQAHKIDFPPLGVPVHVLHIVFEDSLKAVEVLERLKGGEDFEKLAKEYFPGEPEIKDVAYDLGFITQGEMPEEFYRTALSLEEGQISEPVRTGWGFHLIKVVEKKEKGTTFTDIIPAIQRAINLQKAREHLQEWDRRLWDEADIWIDQELLNKLELPKPEG
jgi:parvulin-like peptidyl-prolyl isomerase